MPVCYASMIMKPRLAYLLLFLLLLIGYCFSFTVPFIVDDLWGILSVPAVRGFDIAGMWREHASRFLALLSFALDYKIFAANPVGYHVTNLIIHACNTFLVLHLAEKILGGRNKSLSVGAFLAAGLFAIHPIQVQAVTYIWQRCASLAALFFLSALHLFLKAEGSSERRGLWTSLALLAGVAGIFTKQNVATLPVVIVLLWCAIHQGALPWKRLSFWLIVPLAGVIVNFVFKSLALNHILQSQSVLSPMNYFATQMIVIWDYWRMAVWPAGLRFFYDFSPRGWKDGIILLSAAGHVAVLSFAVAIRKKAPIATFGILFFYITLAVESSVVPLEDLAFEHRLYLPIVGICILSGFLFQKLYNHYSLSKKNPAILAAMMFVLLAPYLYLTVERNILWNSAEALWASNYRLEPNHRDVLVSYATVLTNKGRCQESEVLAKRAYGKTQRNDSAAVALAAALGCLGRYSESDAIVRTIRTDMPVQQYAAFNISGLNLANQGKFIEAEKNFRSALEVYSADPGIWKNLLLVQLDLNHWQEAMKTYSDAEKLGLFSPSVDETGLAQKSLKEYAASHPIAAKEIAQFLQERS